MNSILLYITGNFKKKIRKLFNMLISPRSIKNGLMAALAVLVVSQLFVFYVLIAARVNMADSWQLAFKALNCADCGFFLLWEMLISAIGLLLLKFKFIVFITSIVLLSSGVFLIRVIPDKWYRIGEIRAILLFLAIPIVIFGLVILEILPYFVNNYL